MPLGAGQQLVMSAVPGMACSYAVPRTGPEYSIQLLDVAPCPIQTVAQVFHTVSSAGPGVSHCPAEIQTGMSST